MVNWKPLTTHHLPLTILLLTTCYLLLATDVAYSQKVIIGKPIARFGSIRVNSDPPGAEIYVDVIAKGFTPQVISHLSPGSYCVVIHKEDYIDVIRTAEVSVGTITEMNVKLKSIIRPDMVYPLKGIMVTAERIKPIPVFGNIAFISEKERYEQTMNLSCGMPQSYGGAFTSTGPIGIMNYWVALSGYKGNMGRDYSDYNKLNLFGKFMVPVDETTKLRLLLEILQMEQHLLGIRRYTKNLHLSLAVYSMTIEDKIRYDYLNDKYETLFHLITGVETIWIDILLL